MVPAPSRRSRRKILGSVGVAGAALAGCLGRRAGSTGTDGASEAEGPNDDAEPASTAATTPSTPPDPPDSIDGAWPLERFDASGRESNPDAAGPESAPTSIWERPLEADGRLRGPVLADDVVVAAEGVRVVGIEAPTGAPMWSTTLDVVETSMTDAHVNSVAVADGLALASVYAEATGPSLYALDARSGDVQWAVDDRGLGTAVQEETVYTTADGRVRALALADGAERWRHERDDLQDAFSGPVVDEGRVVVSADRVYALDASDGTELWATAAGTHPESPVVGDGSVFTGGFYGGLVAQSLDDGAERWRYDAGAPTGSVALGATAEGGVGPVLAETNGTQGAAVVHAVAPATGSELWTRARGRVVAAGRGVVYHVEGTRLAALDAGDGSVRWSTTLGVEPRSVAVVDRYLLATGVDGAIRLFG